jgi:uncharacterized protein
MPGPGLEATANPVRIFLGTEDRQSRALRVFLFSIEQHRNPAREYRIYLMKNLQGFDRRGWRTGFTLYRFAIPEFAGGEGRAIYNDVDQIYTADPARLFDLPLDGHGYLAVSAEDTSVMLIDCARMLPWWNLQRARRGRKQALIDAGARSAQWGALDGAWNARDMEYVEGASRLLHYTALHLQPWAPEPERYSYHYHPLGEVWWRAERAADAAGYQPFSADLPSPWFADARLAAATVAMVAGSPRADLTDAVPSLDTLLWCTPGPAGEAEPPLPARQVQHWNHAASDGPAHACDAVAVTRVLEHLPAEDVPWVLDRCCRLARRLLLVTIDDPSGETTDPPLATRNELWWRHVLRRAAAAHPNLSWYLDFGRGGAQRRVLVHAAPRSRMEQPSAPPRVWVLTGPRLGDAQQVRALARALGWPWEEKRLSYGALHHLPNLVLGATTASVARKRSDALSPPWPDLIIGCGKRSVPVARWVQKQSGGQTRLVFLGRPWAPLHWFDLVITTPQYGLPLRDNVYVNTLPLNRPGAEHLDDDVPVWKNRLAELPKPWIGVLVGGGTYPFRFGAGEARDLARQAGTLARRTGGSLLITTSPRTDPGAVSALFEAVDVPAYRHRWGDEDTGNPLPAFLALCERFIVTGDSASMLADAATTGRPVAIAPLPRRLRRLAGLGRWLGSALLGLEGRSHRGTPRQQNRRQRLYDRFVDLGLVQTLRDIDRLQAPLIRRGIVTVLGTDTWADGDVVAPIALPDELAITVARLRERMAERHCEAAAAPISATKIARIDAHSRRAPSR